LYPKELYSRDFPYAIGIFSIILYFDFSVDKIGIIAYGFTELVAQLRRHFEDKSGILTIHAFI
jgi:hypothetical protein